VLLAFKGLQPERWQDGVERNPGIVATAMHCVNAIPYVHRAEPGIKTYPDLPLIAGRRARIGPMIDAEAHVAVFNAAVASGDWATFSARFAADATLAFVGPPVGPFEGREAIAAAYAAQPPDDTITLVGPPADEGDETVVPYRWDTTGATGTMRFRGAPDGAVQTLTVTFD